MIHIHLLRFWKRKDEKFNSGHHEPTSHQLSRFSICCQLLKQNPESLNDNKSSSTCSRQKTARENLSKISSLSSSIFVLCCFRLAKTELGSKSYLEVIPKLRNWWDCVEHPTALADKVRLLCEIEGIEYVQTGEYTFYVLKFTTLHTVDTRKIMKSNLGIAQ